MDRLSQRPVSARTLLRGPLRLPLLAALGVGSFWLAILACDLVLEAASVPRYGRYFPGEPYPELETAAYVEADPHLGWVSSRKIPHVNRQGFRDPRDLDALEGKGDRRRVMVLGDSFVWGVGVKPRETLPRRLGAELGRGFEVYSLAVPGWGIDQMYLAYRRYVDRVDPDYLILAFIDDDVDRVLEAYRPWEGLTKPCLSVRDRRLVPRTEAADWEWVVNKAMWRSLLFSQLARHFFLATDAVPVVRTIFATLAAESAAAGRSFTVLRIPLPDGPRRRPLHLRVDRFPGAERVTRLEAGEALRRAEGWPDALYQEDGHLSAAGHRVLAEWLAERLPLHTTKDEG